MLQNLGWVLAFMVTAVVSGLVFWWRTDWWYYVGTGPDRWPKFKAPAWEQALVSSIVGVVIGGAVVGAVFLLWRILGSHRSK